MLTHGLLIHIGSSFWGFKIQFYFFDLWLIAQSNNVAFLIDVSAALYLKHLKVNKELAIDFPGFKISV